VPDIKFGFLVWEGAVGDINVQISAIFVHCAVTVTAPLELVASFRVEGRAVPTDLLSRGIV
jgi:hypothetical protein